MSCLRTFAIGLPSSSSWTDAPSLGTCPWNHPPKAWASGSNAIRPVARNARMNRLIEIRPFVLNEMNRSCGEDCTHRRINRSSVRDH